MPVASSARSAPNEVALLEKSYLKWKSAKKLCKESYTYTVSTYSFTGFQDVTEIVVRSGKVVQRSRIVYFPSSFACLEWVETETNLNTHPEGAPAYTMDQLYQIARMILSKKITNNFEQRVFVLSSDGLLKSCYIYDTRIADDTEINGVDIDTLTFVAR